MSATTCLRAGQRVLRVVVIAATLIGATSGLARAAEITFLCASALRSSVETVVGEFEQTSGHKVRSTFQIINAIADHVRKGGAADLAIVSAQQWERLDEERKLDPAVRVVIAKLGYGVFVKQGAAKPDISSVAALERTLLNARSITFPSRPGPIAAYQTRLFEQLGVTAELKARLKYPDTSAQSQTVRGPLVLPLVANGEAELGVAAISEILEAPGVELVGPVPPEVQSFITLTAAIPRNASEPAAARDLISFLISPKATAIMRSKGFEPR
jgi:molybdate transport system substrate-binding protein